MKISEVFGPTVQGEGPSTGRRCAFVRLGRCNLDCAWCDTPYTWDWSRFDPELELEDMEPNDVLAQVDAMDVSLLVVTGGEPMVQRISLTTLVAGARMRGIDVEIETNGTQKVDPALTFAQTGKRGSLRFNVSPKLSSSGVARDRAWVDEVIRQFIDVQYARTIFKFVVADQRDWSDVLDFQAVYRPDRASVWIMPLTPFNDVARPAAPEHIAQWAIDEGYNVSSRLHVQLWGNERGH